MKTIKSVFILLAIVFAFSNSAIAAQRSEVNSQGAIAAMGIVPPRQFPQHPMPYPRTGPQGIYYDWGRGVDGFAYCYEHLADGRVINSGQPVTNDLCEVVNPSYFDWGRGRDGWGYCYHFSPYGLAMDAGQPYDNATCEASRVSYFIWALGQDGFNHCYEYTPYGVVMNQGASVGDNYCQ
jgi:hypothetical protein